MSRLFMCFFEVYVHFPGSDDEHSSAQTDWDNQHDMEGHFEPTHDSE